MIVYTLFAIITGNLMAFGVINVNKKSKFNSVKNFIITVMALAIPMEQFSFVGKVIELRIVLSMVVVIIILTVIEKTLFSQKS